MTRRLVAIGSVLVALLLVVPQLASANHWKKSSVGADVHWADKEPTHPRGYVYWADRTGAEWPVYSAAVEWDRASKLDAVYISGSQTCPSTPHCVSVVETSINDACSPKAGQTDWSYYTASGHLETKTLVRVNSHCSNASYGMRRTITCHELGHSIGMNEQTSDTSSCMTSPYDVPRTMPSTHDYQSIASVYRHND